ncbi:MAG TPA: flippase activity-associated protein Agl23 [Verrucomicrobiales bacterium]|nr:flippase activity-associated protein Agl23 [Verrucomicrobiales bacterium]
MSRRSALAIPLLAGFAVVAALILAAVLRLTGLAERPMHLDESIQAYKFGELLETGAYVYDPSDFHGPVLLYSTFPAAWLGGAATFPDLDEVLLRSVPAAYGIALVLLVALSGRALGLSAPLAALLLAVSTPFVYYSRYYIMELPLVFLLAAALWCLHAYLRRPGPLPAATFGIIGGLVHATKETGAISFLAIAVALVTLTLLQKARGEPILPKGVRPVHLILALVCGLAFSALLFSAGLQHLPAIPDSIRTYFSYLQGRPGGEEHHKPFHYYLHVLVWTRQEGVIWTELLTLLFAVAGAVLCWTPGAVRSSSAGSAACWRFLTLYAAVSALIYSAIPYKTPWTLLSWYFPVLLLAAYGALALVALVSQAGRSLGLAAALVVAALLSLGQARELRQTHRAITRYAADNRNPWVYGHTTSNLLRLIDRVDIYSRLHPSGKALPIRVYDAEGWPLPWYFRRYSDVLYSATVPDQPSAGDLVIVTTTEEDLFRPFVETSHTVDNYYGLRHDYLVTLFVENGLWDRFLTSMTSPPPSGR